MGILSKGAEIPEATAMAITALGFFNLFFIVKHPSVIHIAAFYKAMTKNNRIKPFLSDDFRAENEDQVPEFDMQPSSQYLQLLSMPDQEIQNNFYRIIL
jgi:hypothetical protein